MTVYTLKTCVRLFENNSFILYLFTFDFHNKHRAVLILDDVTANFCGLDSISYLQRRYFALTFMSTKT